MRARHVATGLIEPFAFTSALERAIVPIPAPPATDKLGLIPKSWMWKGL